MLRFPDSDFDARPERIEAVLHPIFDWASYHQNPTRGLQIEDAWSTHEGLKWLVLNEGSLPIVSCSSGAGFSFPDVEFPGGDPTASPERRDSFFECTGAVHMCVLGGAGGCERHGWSAGILLGDEPLADYTEEPPGVRMGRGWRRRKSFATRHGRIS